MKLSEDFASSAYMPMVFMSIGVFFNSIALIPHTILPSKGEVRFIAKAHLFQLILMIPAVFYFANNYGLIGAAVVWAVRPILDYVLLNYKASSILKVAS